MTRYIYVYTRYVYVYVVTDMTMYVRVVVTDTSKSVRGCSDGHIQICTGDVVTDTSTSVREYSDGHIYVCTGV